MHLHSTGLHSGQKRYASAKRGAMQVQMCSSDIYVIIALDMLTGIR